MNPFGLHRIGAFLNKRLNAITALGIITVVGIGSLVSCGPSNSFSGNNPAPASRQRQTSDAIVDTLQTPVAPPSSSPVDNRTPAAAPLPPGAIVQGSFTVFANPPNPMEGQDYYVHVRVKLPATLSSYSRSDLSGTLVGTDGYTHTIGYDAYLEKFMSGQGSAELIIEVPGAFRGVNDTLRVTSRALNESQTISIRFN
jgi:hypothetical protein